MTLPLPDRTTIATNDVREKSLDDRHIDPDARIDPRKVGADDYELDTWELPDTLRDSLARIRSQIKAIIGRARWDDSPSVSLEASATAQANTLQQLALIEAEFDFALSKHIAG